AGLLILEPQVFGDARGFFLETYNERRYREAGVAATFVQDNVSFSRRGILRGLHFQNPKPQGKLLQVLQGEVFDVAVDVRRSSPVCVKARMEQQSNKATKRVSFGILLRFWILDFGFSP